MEKYKYLEHTADAKFQAFGKTLEDVFINSALAMFNIMLDTSKVNPVADKKVSSEGIDLKALLYGFLEGLLILLDDGFVLHNVKKIKIEEKNKRYFLTATVSGDEIKKEYKIHGEVKAVTYNEMEIKKEKDYYMVQVVVDL